MAGIEDSTERVSRVYGFNFPEIMAPQHKNVGRSGPRVYNQSFFAGPRAADVCRAHSLRSFCSLFRRVFVAVRLRRSPETDLSSQSGLLQFDICWCSLVNADIVMIYLCSPCVQFFFTCSTYCRRASHA